MVFKICIDLIIASNISRLHKKAQKQKSSKRRAAGGRDAWAGGERAMMYGIVSSE